MRPIQPNIFDSVEHMVSPHSLSRLLGGFVDDVERRPLEVEHLSGNRLERLDLQHNGRIASLVLKHFSLEHDWVMRLTHDKAVREVALFRLGVYKRLPLSCYVPIIAAARNDDMWTSLMVDVSDGLVPSETAVISLPDLELYLAHLAAVHARFLGERSLLQPDLGLSSLRDFALILSPGAVQQELAQGRSHPALTAAADGWVVFGETAPPAAVQALVRLQTNVRPLLEQLSSLPHTLVHGDYKLGNLGVLSPDNAARESTPPQRRTIMLDWQDATCGPPLLDVGYLLMIDAARLPVGKEEVVAIYHEALAAAGRTYAHHEWEREVEIGLLAGGAMRVLWQTALRTRSTDPVLRSQARADLEWWSELVIRAQRWLRQ